MTNAHDLPFLRRKATPRPSPFTPREYEVESVEIFAPDQYCATLLLGFATPLFPAELVAGPGWIVRSTPPSSAAWVPDLLSLVERWLAAVPLPATKLSYGGQNYVIRESPYGSPFAALPEPASQPAA